MKIWVVCPTCGNKFAVDMWSIKILEESFKRNPTLKFICPPCGKKVILKYWRKHD